MSNKIYVRFGEIPKNERSKIYHNFGDTTIGEEIGRGADNEPLIRNIKILETLPSSYFDRVK